MEHEICHVVKGNLKDRPKQLTALRQWLFVTVNTAKAIIDNTSKQSLEQISKFAACRRTSEMQLEFDAIQGTASKMIISNHWAVTDHG